MQIVIDIPKRIKELCDSRRALSLSMIQQVEIAISAGTPLPEHHGRLIDADYKVSSDGRTIDSVCGYMVPTIIESDKGDKK